ncbi:galactokinase [Halioglobus japonicus]|uniref:Galactokinase n=1 Tax=Halioglobus japonicus TaxID=930805 RepID=A0AAP8ME84_9GAMM|nr:galactokinase [Halioglobus japonicus]AQA18164.1 galactokinase [Halioglobus japonicus]PLW86165.1 galactokinase [Halioglobus japonicus]GHD14112.1 galactokinase [Halioglobus japonicus]
MQDQILSAFESTFGARPAALVRAPGRVNLIGEHTDYNAGYVLPCAISYETLVAISPRQDSQVNVIALDWELQCDTFDLQQPIDHHPQQQWSNYVRGVAVELIRRDYALRGCDIAITGNVPQGAGLSSSAALEVGLAKAMLIASDLDAHPLELALIGQAAENDFVGCACGIMDQLISAAGVNGQALLIDCQDLAITSVRLPDSLRLVMINSNVQRGLVDSEYNTRREQCEAVAAHFGLSSLRQLDPAQFAARASELEPVARKRAQHVLEENQRVLDTVAALEQGDLPRLGQLMAASHASMRDLFEITTPEIDLLVETLSEVAGERGGARMTGGGFGGCVVALLAEDLVDSALHEVNRRYFAATGLRETVYQSEPCAGVSVIFTD